MIFKYSKRFRFPPSFNNYNIGLFDQKTLLSSTISKRKQFQQALYHETLKKLNLTRSSLSIVCPLSTIPRSFTRLTTLVFRITDPVCLFFLRKNIPVCIRDYCFFSENHMYVYLLLDCVTLLYAYQGQSVIQDTRPSTSPYTCLARTL